MCYCPGSKRKQICCQVEGGGAQTLKKISIIDLYTDKNVQNIVQYDKIDTDLFTTNERLSRYYVSVQQQTVLY